MEPAGKRGRWTAHHQCAAHPFSITFFWHPEPSSGDVDFLLSGQAQPAAMEPVCPSGLNAANAILALGEHPQAMTVSGRPWRNCWLKTTQFPVWLRLGAVWAISGAANRWYLPSSACFAPARSHTRTRAHHTAGHRGTTQARGTPRRAANAACTTYLIGVWPDQKGSRHTNGPCIALRSERW